MVGLFSYCKMLWVYINSCCPENHVARPLGYRVQRWISLMARSRQWHGLRKLRSSRSHGIKRILCALQLSFFILQYVSFTCI